MSKDAVDKLIHNMKLGGVTGKILPWMVEGVGEKAMNVRYVGLVLTDDWLEIFSSADNVLLKFVIDRTDAFLEWYIANKPPFFRFSSQRFSDGDKWENLLGEMKRRLKHDKEAAIRHTEDVGNLYARIKSLLRP